MSWNGLSSIGPLRGRLALRPEISPDVPEGVSDHSGGRDKRESRHRRERLHDIDWSDHLAQKTKSFSGCVQLASTSSDESEVPSARQCRDSKADLIWTSHGRILRRVALIDSLGKPKIDSAACEPAVKCLTPFWVFAVLTRALPRTSPV